MATAEEPFAWRSPWLLVLQIAALVVFGSLGLLLLSSEEWEMDRRRGTWSSTFRWLFVPLRRNAGRLDKIECFRFEEKEVQDSEASRTFYHLYLCTADEEVYLAHMPHDCEEGLAESRALALFVGCPLKMRFLSRGPSRFSERQESVEDIKRALASR